VPTIRSSPITRPFDVEALDADIIHIGAAMDHGADIGLGDDQEIRSLQEVENFRRGGDLVLSEPQHQHIRIGKNTETFGLRRGSVRPHSHLRRCRHIHACPER
jgi:hypothetical protein